jgi:hypothetical protein
VRVMLCRTRSSFADKTGSSWLPKLIVPMPSLDGCKPLRPNRANSIATPLVRIAGTAREADRFVRASNAAGHA